MVTAPTSRSEEAPALKNFSENATPSSSGGSSSSSQSLQLLTSESSSPSSEMEASLPWPCPLGGLDFFAGAAALRAAMASSRWGHDFRQCVAWTAGFCRKRQWPQGPSVAFQFRHSHGLLGSCFAPPPPPPPPPLSPPPPRGRLRRGSEAARKAAPLAVRFCSRAAWRASTERMAALILARSEPALERSSSASSLDSMCGRPVAES